MQNGCHIAEFIPRSRKYLHALGYVLIATLMGASCLHAAPTATNQTRDPVEDIAALASSARMLTVAEGLFIMGTARHKPMKTVQHSDLQYDDTEQPQRRVWLRSV